MGIIFYLFPEIYDIVGLVGLHLKDVEAPEHLQQLTNASSSIE
jgi:hypothetical protein